MVICDDYNKYSFETYLLPNEFDLKSINKN